jgi:hypothetical protein
LPKIDNTLAANLFTGIKVLILKQEFLFPAKSRIFSNSKLQVSVAITRVPAAQRIHFPCWITMESNYARRKCINSIRARVKRVVDYIVLRQWCDHKAALVAGIIRAARVGDAQIELPAYAEERRS